MKGKKIIITSIIINIITIGIIYNFIKKDYFNNEKVIVKAMTGTEYEDYITSLNQSHMDYANYIQESKTKIASAITEMGVTTSDEETFETMANNIKSIDRDTKSGVDLSMLVDVPYFFNSFTGAVKLYFPFTADNISKLIIDVGNWTLTTAVYINDNLIYQGRRDNGTVVVDITEYLTTEPMKLTIQPVLSTDATSNYSRETHFDVIDMK